MIRSLIALAACVALTACSLTAPPSSTPPPASSGGIVATAGTVVMTGARAFAAAELVYISAAEGVTIAARNGLIRGALATEIREKNRIAGEWLVKGKAATDSATKAVAAAELLRIATRFQEVAPAPK